IGTLIFFLAFRRSIQWKRILGLVLVGAFALAVNLFWLESTRYYRIFQEYRASYQSSAEINIIWQELLGKWEGHAQGSKVYGLLALLSLWAWFGRFEESEKKIVRSFVVTGVFLIVFAATGGISHRIGQMLEPNRFAPIGYLYLVIPSTYGLK